MDRRTILRECYTNELIGGWLEGGIDLQMNERMNGRTPSV